MSQCNAFKGYKTTKEAKEALGVKEDALRRWADAGLFPSIRTPGGQRLYNIQQYVEHCKNNFGEEQKTNNEKQKICYCRVSSNNQKDDLERQVVYMSERFPTHRIITDIGPGINFKRKGFRTIMELSCKGIVDEVVVAYRDRMCRFSFELVDWILQINGVKLLVLNQSLESSGQSELAEDLLSIINVFNCRVNGKRKYKKQEKANEEGEEGEEGES